MKLLKMMFFVISILCGCRGGQTQQNPALGSPPTPPQPAGDLVYEVKTFANKPEVWINPVVKQKAGDAAESTLQADLQSCAATATELPGWCSQAQKFITVVQSGPGANCHWQCGSNCLDLKKCAWKVTAGAWSLEYRRPASKERVPRKTCNKKWEAMFNDPAQYEESSCEVDCLQTEAVVALSKVDPACAMEAFGVLALRPRCFGEIPGWCRSDNKEPQ